MWAGREGSRRHDGRLLVYCNRVFRSILIGSRRDEIDMKFRMRNCAVRSMVRSEQMALAAISHTKRRRLRAGLDDGFDLTLTRSWIAPGVSLVRPSATFAVGLAFIVFDTWIMQTPSGHLTTVHPIFVCFITELFFLCAGCRERFQTQTIQTAWPHNIFC